MKNEQDNIDKLIHESLQKDDQSLSSQFEELGITEAIAATFKGRSRWLVMIAFVDSLFFLGLMIYSGYQFFSVEIVKEMVLWATVFLFCTQITIAIKIWYWMELQKNAMTRELKRFELQVAQFRNDLKK